MRTKYCLECGERLALGADVCPNCGAPVPPDRAGGRRSRKIAAAAAAIFLVLAAALAVLVLPGLTRSDTENFIYYQARLLVRPLADAITYGMSRASDGAGTDITVTARSEDPSLGPYLQGTSAVVKLGTGDGFIAELTAKFMGGHIFAGTLTCGGGRMGFYIPQVEDTYYTVDIPALAAGAGVPDVADVDSWPDARETAEIAARYLKIVSSVINEDDMTVERDQTVPFAALNGQARGTLYTFTPSAQAVESTIEALAGALEGDGQLSDYILKAAGAAGKKLSPIRARAALTQLATALRALAPDAGRAVRESGFEWTLAVEDGDVRRIVLSASGISAGLEISPGPDGAEAFAVFTQRDGGEAQVWLSGTRTRKGGRAAGALRLSFPGVRAELEYDCEPGSISPLGLPAGRFTLAAAGGSYDLYVTEREDGSFDHAFTVPAAALGLEWDVSVTVNATKTGTAAPPGIPETDISGLSAGELRGLVRDLLGELARDLRFAVGEIPGFTDSFS